MKMKLEKDKRGMLRENIVFLILQLLFFSFVLIGVLLIGSGTAVYENIYARQIALAIDEAKPDMNLDIDISKLYEVAEKNKFNGKIVEIDEANHQVIVHLTIEQGHKFSYFSDYKVDSSLNGITGLLNLEIKKNA